MDPSKVPLPTPIEFAEGEDVREICKRLNARMREVLPEGVVEHFEGFSAWSSVTVDNQTHWPKSWHWIVVYPVTGDSEVYYIHIDTVRGEHVHRYLAMSKTFAGW